MVGGGGRSTGSMRVLKFCAWRRDNEYTKSMCRCGVAVSELARSVSPFYEKLNGLLADRGFDEFVETPCRAFYADTMGQPSLVPGQYFRLLFGLATSKGWTQNAASPGAWRTCLGVRAFLGLALTQAAPDHSTISRTRQLIWTPTERCLHGVCGVGYRRSGQWKTARDRRHQARSERRLAQHRAPRQLGEL